MTHLQVIWYTDWSQRTAHAALNLAAQPSCPCRPGRRWGLKPWKNNLQTSHEMVDWLNRQETVWIVNFQKILMSQSLNPIMPSISFYDSMIRRIKGAMTQRSFKNISAVWMLCLWALVVIQPPVYIYMDYIHKMYVSIYPSSWHFMALILCCVSVWLSDCVSLELSRFSTKWQDVKYLY